MLSKKSKIDCFNIVPRADKSVENEAKQGKGRQRGLALLLSRNAK